jgi:hypothetical protein
LGQRRIADFKRGSVAKATNIVRAVAEDCPCRRIQSINRSKRTPGSCRQHRIIERETAMKRLGYAIGLMGAVAIAALILARIGEGSTNEQTNQVACTYYGGSCISPGIFSGTSIRLFP